MNLEKLSDVELRFELLKRGFPNVPITETTRKILIKRLKNYMSQNERASSVYNRTLRTSPSNGQKSSLPPIRRSMPHVVSTKYESHNVLDKFNRYSTNTTEDSKLAYMGKSSSPYSNSISDSKRVSSNIYVSPLIISDDEENTNNSYAAKGENSNVVSRLLKLRDTTIQSSTGHLYLNESESDGDSTSGHRGVPNVLKQDRYTLVSNILRFSNFTNAFKQSSIPYLLMTLFSLFFVMLSLLYVTKPPDLSSTVLEKSATFTTCEEFKQLPTLTEVVRPSVNCIESDILPSALALNRELIQRLQSAAEAHYCRDSSISSEISGTNFMKCTYKKHAADVHQVLRSFHAAMYLIDKNPQWKISIINKSESDILPDIYQQDIRFTLVNPHLPWKCVILNKLQRFFCTIGTVFLVALLFLVFFGTYHYLKRKQQTRSMAVEYFIKEIINELTQRLHNKEIIITHLRDKLIPNNKKDALLWAWNEALRELESTDSRIQFGTTLYNGEEFRTIKWDATHPIKLQEDSHCKKRQWQSPAFENTNNCFEPPTTCLKIRHMFDISEINQVDLKQNIIDSILEKVSSQCRIYDVQLDKQSCCVFIRCASERDAGIIYNKINGWWFNNRLVSIKFIRVQRFLARFPNSKAFPSLITPTRNE